MKFRHLLMLRQIIYLLLVASTGATFDAFAQASFLTPSENLVAEGIPPIPATLSEEIGRYTDMRAAVLLGWHPVRREILVSTRFADTPQVHLVTAAGGSRTQLTFFKDRVTQASWQPTKGDYFVFSKDTGGAENFQFYRFDLTNGATTLLTDGKSRNTGGVWSHAGDKLAYGSTRRTGKDVDLWIMDPANPASNRMLAQLEGGGWVALDFSPDDKQLIVMEEISANETYLSLMDLDTGARTLLTPKGGPEKIFYGDSQFSKDGKGIYITTDRDSEYRRLAYVDLATKKYTFLTDSAKWDVTGFQLSWDGRMIAFIANEGGRGVLHLLHARTGKEVPAPKIPQGYVAGINWHKNNRDLGFTFQSAHNPPDAWSLDVKNGKLERWTSSETGGVNTSSFPEPELITWTSFDGRKISGWLHHPPAKFTGKRPVVIQIHGGPESQALATFLGENSYLVNELGVAVLQPNVRGSTGYGKTFALLDNGFKREDSYRDIGALLEWLPSRPHLDPQRVMVTGASYGGHMTLVAATRFADRIRCALDVVGIGNLVTMLENTSAYRRDLRRAEYGDERDPKMREFLNRIAPLNNATSITKPLFVVQGGNDPRVPMSESVQMVEAARKNGTPVWYLMAKDEGHGFTKKKNRDFQVYATAMFVKEFLLK